MSWLPSCTLTKSHSGSLVTEDLNRGNSFWRVSRRDGGQHRKPLLQIALRIPAKISTRADGHHKPLNGLRSSAKPVRHLGMPMKQTPHTLLATDLHSLILLKNSLGETV